MLAAYLNKKKQQQEVLKKIKELKAQAKERLKEQTQKIMKDRNNCILYKSLLKPFDVKISYNSKIPLNLYTCWHSKDLPPLMQQNYLELVINNPEFKHFLYDENECREFIKDNFDENVLNAYNSLIPCSYKSDLWRFCVLYINGGIYLDIKYKCVNGFKLIALTEKEYFVRDRPENCVYTALIVTMPKNQIMLDCINKIVENVKNKYYGISSLHPTGPGVLGLYFSKEDINKLQLYFEETIVEGKINDCYIVYTGKIILNYYPNYRAEQKIFQKNKYYSDLWKERKIYTNLK